MRMVGSGVLLCTALLGASSGVALSDPAVNIVTEITAQDDPPPCDPHPVVRVTYRINQARADKRCDVATVSPDPVPVCAETATIAWHFVNHCDRRLKLKIKDRKSVYPEHDNGEPFTTKDDFKHSPEYVAENGGTADIPRMPVRPNALDGRYKYDIDGTVDTDPEIDVRRGPGIRCTSPNSPPDCVMEPSVAPTPNPGGRR